MVAKHAWEGLAVAISIRLLIAVAALMLMRAPPAIPPRKASVD